MKSFPRAYLGSLRVFSACLLSALMLMMPIAPLAAAASRASSTPAARKSIAKRKPKLGAGSAGEKLEKSLFVNPVTPAIAAPNVTASMTDAFVDSNASGKADPGSTVTYTATISNTGSADANGVMFDDTPDPNTTQVPGSIKVSPLAFADTYNVKQNTTLNVAAAGLLTNDTGTPAPTVGAITNPICVDGVAPFVCSTSQGGLITVNADGSFTYTPVNAAFTGADTFTYSATNGQAPDDTAVVTINVNANQAPVLANIEPGTLGYGNASPPVQITNTLTVADADDTNIESATVSITNNFVNGEDVLSFTNQNGITGNYVAATGILTLTGSATLANYQTALRSITYSDSAGSPTQSVRTITFVVNDGDVNSNTQTRDINVSSTSAPVVTAGATLNYTENDPATVIDNTITVTDSDSANLTGATAQITGNYTSTEDVLSFVNQLGITGSYNSANGTMTLTGTTTVANYQTALRAIKYNNTSESPSTAARTVTWIATDGTTPSTGVTSTINVTSVNDAPVLANIEAGALAYTENDAATAVTSTITVSDLDSTNLTGATVQITGNYQSTEDVLSFVNQLGITGSYNSVNGTMTLSGTTTLANYQTALRAVKYNNTSENPSTLARTVTFQVNDGAALNNLSNTQTRNINVTSVNDAPVLANIEAAAVAYNENDPAVALTSTITVTDADSTNLTGATVQITGNYQSTEDVLSFVNQLGITGSYNSVNGTMTLSGTTTVANYQTALRAVKYNNTSDSPSTLSRTVTFQVNDGAGVNNLSNTQTRNINVASVNDAPVLANIEAAALAYNENDAATAVSSTITVSDLDSTNLAGATVQITGNYQSTEDVLSFVNQLGITGSYNSANGTMTLSGTTTVANYQTALRAVKYNNTSENPSTLARTVTFQVNDGGAVNNLSNTQTRNINVTSVNDAPALVTSGGSASFTEDGAAVAVDPGITVSDVDNANIASATVQITGNYQNGQDVLAFVDQNGITGVFTPATGILALTGSASVANYQLALRSITYNNTSQNPNTTARTVSFTVSDGVANSNTATRGVTVTAVNDAPVLAAIEGGALAYTENDAATAITSSITVNDVDNATLTSGTVSITSNFQSGQDVLSFVNVPATMGNIAGVYTAGTGVMTLTSAGSSATLAQWQVALRAVKYNNSSDDPNTTTRTVTFQVDDGQALNHASNTQTRNITVTAVNDPPTANGFAGLPAQAAIPIMYPAGKLGGTDVEAGTTITIDTTPINQTNGTAVLSADGSFVFTPLPNATTGSFQYRVMDNGNPAPGVNSAYVTVSFTVAGPAIYFVRQSAVGLGNCTLGNECTLATAQDVSHIGAATNTRIFVEDNGSGTYTTSVTLNSNGWLIGQGVTGTTFDALFGIGAPAQGTLAARPSLGLASPTITVSSAGVNVVNLTSAGTTNSVRGLVLTTGTATTKAISGSGFGTLTTSDLVITGSGPALDLTTGSLSGSFTSISSSGGANGIKLTTVGGSSTLGSGALAGATADEFFVNGGTVTLTYNGTINTTAAGAHPVNISNKTSSGNVTFNGAVSAGTSSAGVSLDNNDGALITFRGGLSLTTTTNAAFTAINGGTIEVCDENPCNPAATGALVNTLTTTTGTALNVANTTISANRLEFRSISSNGATNGIILNTTGASGGLIVKGNGGSCTSVATCTGGTIQGGTIGINLTSTRDVSIDRMFVFNTSSSGINGTTVTNFSFTNGKIDVSGTTLFQSNIAFNTSPTTASNIAGTLTITGNTLTNAFYSGLDIQAGDGTITNANISNNVITSTTSVATSAGFGININGVGTATTAFALNNATITSNTITNFPTASGIQINGGNANATGPRGTIGIPGDPSNLVSITSNTIQGQSAANRMGGSAIIVAVIGGNNTNATTRSRANINISSNPTLTNIAGTVIGVGCNGHTTMTATVNNNVIVANQQANFGGANGIGGGVGIGGGGAAWVGALTMTVTGNNISQTDGNGILLVNRATNGTMDLKITGNTVGAPINAGGTARQGIRVDSGNGTAGEDTAVCVTISGNTSAGSNGGAGIGIRKQGVVVGTDDFGITGLAPSPATGAQAAAYVVTQNPAGGGCDNISGSNFISCASAPPIAPPGDPGVATNGIGREVPSNSLALTRISPAKNSPAKNIPQTSGTPRKSTAEPSKIAKAQSSAQLRANRSADRTMSHHARGTAKARLATTAMAPPPAPPTFPISIGTIPAGKSVTVTFQVTLNTAMPFGTTEVSNQGSVSGSNFATVLTDDPAPPPPHVNGATDPTITPIDAPTASASDVSGQILDSNGLPVEGAAVRMTGTQNRLTVTDANGHYHFDNVETNGFYNVIPSRANFMFSPTDRSFSQLGNHTDAIFTGTYNGGTVNPLDTTEYFVRQQYVDFFNREPDEAGFNFWVHNIEACGDNQSCRAVKRADTSAAFFLSVEFQQTGYLVYKIYQSAYGDMANAPVPLTRSEFKPDTETIGQGVVVNQTGWETLLENNKQTFTAEFVTRSRFTAAYPTTMSPAEFVDKLFTNAGVAPSDGDRTLAINEFNAAADSSNAGARARALRRVAENLTLNQQEFNQAFVLMEYFGYLRRSPPDAPEQTLDYTGYNFWLTKLERFNGDYRKAQMVQAFLVASEYRQRFPR